MCSVAPHAPLLAGRYGFGWCVLFRSFEQQEWMCQRQSAGRAEGLLDAVDSTRLVLLGEVSLYFCTELDIWDVVVGKDQPAIYDADAPKHSVL